MAVTVTQHDVDRQLGIAHAIRSIEKTYSATVSVWEKGKTLLKFGRAPNVGASKTTLWAHSTDEANETYVAANTNSIDTISSTSAADDQDVKIEGQTESGGVRTFVVQSATLNGQNKVTLDTPLNRVTRLYNNDTTELAGTVYVYEDGDITAGVPNDTSTVHLRVPAGAQQSRKASTSLSSVDYWIITEFYCDYLEKTGANFAEVTLEIREYGKVFLPVADIGIGTGESSRLVFEPYVIAPALSDVRLVAVASAASQDISGGIVGYLAITTS